MMARSRERLYVGFTNLPRNRDRSELAPLPRRSRPSTSACISTKKGLGLNSDLQKSKGFLKSQDTQEQLTQTQHSNKTNNPVPPNAASDIEPVDERPVTPDFFKHSAREDDLMRIRAVQQKSMGILATLRSRSLGKHGQGNIKQVFREYDVNRDGRVSLDELNAFLCKLHLQDDLPPEDAAVLFKCFNADEDNCIDFSTFAKVFDPNVPEGHIFTSTGEDGENGNAAWLGTQEANSSGGETLTPAQLQRANETCKKMAKAINSQQDAKSAQNRQQRQFLLQSFGRHNQRVQEGYVTYAELREGLGPTGMNLSIEDHELIDFIRLCDKTGSGVITTKDFLKLCEVTDEALQAFGHQSRQREMDSLAILAASPTPDFNIEQLLPWPLQRFHEMQPGHRDRMHRPATVPGASGTNRHGGDGALSPGLSDSASEISFQRRTGGCSPGSLLAPLSSDTRRAELQSRGRQLHAQEQRRLHSQEAPISVGSRTLRDISRGSGTKLTRWSMKPKPVNTSKRVGFGTGAAVPGTPFYLDDAHRMRSTYQAQHSKPIPGQLLEFSSPIEHLAKADRKHGRVLLQMEQQISLDNHRQRRMVGKKVSGHNCIRGIARQRLRYLEGVCAEELRNNIKAENVGKGGDAGIAQRNGEVSKDSMFSRHNRSA